MKINFKATNIELNDNLRARVLTKLSTAEKLLSSRESGDEGLVLVELGRTTTRHKHGDIFRAEINLNWSGNYFRAEASASDLYSAIDEAKDGLMSEIKNWRKRQETVFRRGARRIKSWLRDGR